MNGPGAVKGEQRGLGPLAVQGLAKEFRRLAAEAKARTQMNIAYHATQNTDQGHYEAFEQAAQMLEERLNG